MDKPTKDKPLTKDIARQLMKDGLAVEFNGEYYSTYMAEMNSVNDSGHIQCETCHDVFKKPFKLYFCLTKRQVLLVCPNGCQTIQEYPEPTEVING